MIHLSEGRKVNKIARALREAEAHALTEAARVREQADKRPGDTLDDPEYREVLRLLHQVT